MSCRFGSLACVLLMAALAVAQSAPQRTIASLPLAPSAVRAEQPSWSYYRLSPADRPYVPLTSRQKFHHFAHSLYSPYTFASGLYDATWNQATGAEYRYGGGMEGWGKRLGCAYTDAATGQFFGYFLLPTLLHQDPRYFPVYHGSILARLKHAASSVVLTRGDDGTTQFNTSGLLGMAATSAAENLWLPAGQRSGVDVADRMLGSLQGAATGYVLREFTPDLLRLFRRHAPKPLRNVEQNIPAQIITGAPTGDD
ncbi:MAG: hypothetical protein ACRD3E_15765 [Terriglobales bacterium]